MLSDDLYEYLKMCYDLYEYLNVWYDNSILEKIKIYKVKCFFKIDIECIINF